MAKKKNKNKSGATSMEIASESNWESAKGELPLTRAVSGSLDASVTNSGLGVVDKKIKKSAPPRRSKVLRQRKAVERAVSKSEKTEEKILKSKSKVSRIRSAKALYD